MEASVAKSEKRRAPRIPAQLLVMIEGLQDEYSLARGNISSTGVLLELPSAPGSPGDLELLHLATTDEARTVAVMGQIVRCVTIDTLGAQPMVAVVFEFLPERREVRSDLKRLIKHILLQNREQQEELVVEHRVPIEVEAQDGPSTTPKEATVFRLEVKRMLLETTWPVSSGDRVQLSFRCGKLTLPFEGEVVSCLPQKGLDPATYTIEVAVGEMKESAQDQDQDNDEPQLTFDESVDLILTDIVASEPPEPDVSQRHLAGRLERIPLTSLLTFLEMERQSGRLEVDNDVASILFIDRGHVIDILPESEAPRTQLEGLLSQTEGRFTFTCEPIDRTDRIQLSTTHLLLDWARRADESHRASPGPESVGSPAP